jgi:hypothetical protein
VIPAFQPLVTPLAWRCRLRIRYLWAFLLDHQSLILWWWQEAFGQRFFTCREGTQVYRKRSGNVQSEAGLQLMSRFYRRLMKQGHLHRSRGKRVRLCATVTEPTRAKQPLNLEPYGIIKTYDEEATLLAACKFLLDDVIRRDRRIKEAADRRMSERLK